MVLDMEDGQHPVQVLHVPFVLLQVRQSVLNFSLK